MESRLLSKIILRLLAVWLIARGIMFLPDFYMLPGVLAGGHSAIFDPYLWFVIPVLAPLIAGLVLWGIASPVANWMVGTVSDPLQIFSTKTDIQGIAIATAGLIIAILAIPNVANWLIQTYANSYSNGIRRVLDPSVLAFFIASVLQLLLGLLLIFGVRFWVYLLRRIREFGLESGTSE